MLFSLLLSASVLFHAKPAPNPAHSRSSSSRHSQQHSNASSRKAVITAVKGDIQFVVVTPPAPGASSPAFVPNSSAPAPTPPSVSSKPPFVQDTPAQKAREEQFLIDAINTARTQRGLEALTPDPLLTETARAHSREMDDQGYFDHHSPTEGLTTPMDRYWKTLQAWGEGRPLSAIVGENIFYCSETTETYNMAFAHQSLMDSPGHRANILEPRFTKVGVGLCRDRQGRFWVTELFLRDE